MKKTFEHLLMHHYAGRDLAYALAFLLILAKIHYFDRLLVSNGLHWSEAALVKMHYYAFQLV